MITTVSADQDLWRSLLCRLQHEVGQLSTSERAWIEPRLARVAQLQESMHQCFLQAGGAGLCRDCAGDCCGCGKNHVTLVNLLPYLLAACEPPIPDFSRDCPQMTEQGCQLPPDRRPFNCISFICEAVEAAMDAPSRTRFYALEGELRALYGSFDERYAGSSLRGLFIRAGRLGSTPWLAPVGRL